MLQLQVWPTVIIGNKHGIKNGWFNWPVNFDPVWLQYCKKAEDEILGKENENDKE